MKRKVIILLTALIVALSFSCDGLLGMLLPMSVNERIAAFTVTINSEDRTADAILLHFAPESEMINRENAEDIGFWDLRFDPDASFAITVTDSSDPLNVTAAMVKTVEGAALDPVELIFVMYQEASGNYLIKEIWDDITDTTDGWLIRQINQ